MIEPSAIAIPNILFLDIKTSGIFLKGEPLESHQQPWAPYIAAMQCNSAGQIINHFATYIKPEDRTVKKSAIEKHGIDTRAAARLGVPESRVLGLLSDMLKVAPFQSAHSVVTFGDMDKMMIGSLLARFALSLGKNAHAFSNLWLSRAPMTFIDIQKPVAQQVCKLPSEFEDGDYKWPSFSEAARAIVGREPSVLRDSLEDLLILKDMYFNLRARGFFVELGEAK